MSHALLLRLSNCTAEHSSQRSENCAHFRRAPKKLPLQWPQIGNNLPVLHRRDDWTKRHMRSTGAAPTAQGEPLTWQPQGCDLQGAVLSGKQPVSEGVGLCNSVYIILLKWQDSILGCEVRGGEGTGYLCLCHEGDVYGYRIRCILTVVL